MEFSCQQAHFRNFRRTGTSGVITRPTHIRLMRTGCGTGRDAKYARGGSVEESSWILLGIGAAPARGEAGAAGFSSGGLN